VKTARLRTKLQL